MKEKAIIVSLLFVMLSGHIASARQNTNPLTGTWKGDWGLSPTDRNAVILELKWNGKTLTGTVNPGPDAIPIEKASFDAKSMKIHMEATKTSPNFVYVVDGIVEKDRMTGSWSRPNRQGDFQLTREVKRKTYSDQNADAPKLVGLKSDEQRIVRYLLNDWGKDYSITSVDVGIGALGLQQSDELRFRVGNYIKNHPEVHAVIRQWGWQTVALNPNEKLVARAIINAQRDKQPEPGRSGLAKAVGISEKEAESAVAMLARYGILKRDKSAGGVGYVAAESRYVNWQPWLDFQFHRVALSSGRIFNTNWAVDFLSLVSDKLSSEQITVDDSSPDSTNRIRIVFDKGQVVQTEPASTVVFLGGGWAVNNLFSSEEALNGWLERYPELKGRPPGTVAQTLEGIKARRLKQ